MHPEKDGSVTIPQSNLFPPGTPDTRPEIYVMGCRNPFRIGVDARCSNPDSFPRRARFIDPKRPRQPREREELRQLLSQVIA